MMTRAKGKGENGTGGGCIINIASLLGIKGGRGSVAYAASKAGVIGKFFTLIVFVHSLSTSFESPSSLETGVKKGENSLMKVTKQVHRA